MDKKIQQGLEWLNKEMNKDQKEILDYKKKMIDEVQSLDKSKIFVTKPKKKVSFWNKMLIILGYGKKG